VTVAIGLGLAVLTRPSAALKLEAAVHGSGSAIVGAAEPPTELAIYILHHQHIRVDGLVVRVKVRAVSCVALRPLNQQSERALVLRSALSR
jgi:hypothetical protein